MSRKELAIVAGLGIVAIVQVSFTPHFAIFTGKWFEWVNFVNVAVAVIAVFEKRTNRLGWVAALWGGIFLDVYSGRVFGFWIAVLLSMVVFVKYVLKKYVRFPSFW